MLKLIKQYYRKYNTAVARERTKFEDETYWNAAVRNIAPATIEEHNHGKYVIINSTDYVRCVIVGVPRDTINGYPQGLSENLISRLIGLSTYGNRLSLSLKLIPIGADEATKMIQKSVFINKMNQDDSKNRNVGGMVDLNLQIDQEHNVSNYRAIMENKDRLFHSAFIITFKSKSVDGLNAIESDVRTILESEMVQYEFPDYRQKETFLSAQPFNITPDYTQVEILSPYAAVLTSARNPNSRTDNQGLYFGYDRFTNKSIMVDLDALAAQHLLGVGATGSGKTFTLLMLLMRAHSMLNRRIIYCTPKADSSTNHRAVVDYLGDTAELIDIGPNGHNINPMQILYDRSQMRDDPNEYVHSYNTHKGILTKFFSVWFEDTGSINMSNFIDYSLNKVYEAAGVYRDIPSTWHEAKWPVLRDLIAFWEDELKTADADDRKTIKAVLNKTFSLGEKGTLEYMNRPTDIKLDKDFIIIDLSNTPEQIKDSMNVLVTGILGMRFRTDMKKKTIIAIDEARVFLQNPMLSKFLMTTLTQGRSAGCALWLLTQQSTDLKKGGVAEEFQTNIFLKLVLSNNMTKDNVKHVSEYFGLDSTDIENLLSSGVGDGLLIVGDAKTPLEFKPTQLEMDIIKGKYLRNDKKAAVSELSELDERLISLVMSEGLCLDSWAPSSTMIQGWTRHQVANVAGAGLKTAWIRNDALPGNMTIDHFATVISIAGHLLLQNADDVVVNHFDGADITFKINDETYSLEYERDNNKSESLIIEKKFRQQSIYDHVIFVCKSTYYKKLCAVVGADFVVKRGQALTDYLDSIQ